MVFNTFWLIADLSPKIHEYRMLQLASSGKTKPTLEPLGYRRNCQQVLIERHGCLDKEPIPSFHILIKALFLPAAVHSPGRMLWSAAGVHHALQPTAKRDDGAVVPNLKNPCLHRPSFEALRHPSRSTSGLFGFYNPQRPHDAMDMQTPAEVYVLGVQPAQILLGQYRRGPN